MICFSSISAEAFFASSRALSRSIFRMSRFLLWASFSAAVFLASTCLRSSSAVFRALRCVSAEAV